MTVWQITKPAALVTAEEARAAGAFSAEDADARIQFLLSTAQQSIDGPHGRLGRAVGDQELEAVLPSRGAAIRPIQLPLPTATAIISVHAGPAGDEAVIAPGAYAFDGANVIPRGSWAASEAIRIRYKAGWTAQDVPEVIKHAIIMMAGQLKTLQIVSGALRRETIDGVGTWDYVMPDTAASALRGAADDLLRPFKVYHV
jgi:hypothetical protein